MMLCGIKWEKATTNATRVRTATSIDPGFNTKSKLLVYLTMIGDDQRNRLSKAM